ncbi:ABC transporter substrate-binding protein [Candidatus Methylocalor cossyra]
MSTAALTKLLLPWIACLVWVGGFEAAVAAVPTEINFGVASVGLGGRPFVGGSVVSVVHVKGWLEEEFKDQGIKINWHFFKTAGPGVNEAYSNGVLDFAWQGDLPQLIGRASGLKVKYILGAGRRQYIYLAAKPNSSAARIEDIKGRSVAIHKGTCLQLSIARLLAAHGLRERDLKVYNMDGLAAASALGSGDLELAFGAFNLLALRDQGLAKVIYSGAEDDGRYGCSGGFTVTEDFLARYPDITRRVVKTIVKAARWSADPANRGELYAIWAKSGFPLEHFKEEWDSQDLKRKLSPLIDDFQINRYRVALEDARKFGLVRGKVDFDRYFDRSYLEAALTELGLQDFWIPEDAEGKPQSPIPHPESGARISAVSNARGPQGPEHAP